MIYFEQRSQLEIARCFHQPLGVIETDIRPALLKLRAALSWVVR